MAKFHDRLSYASIYTRAIHCDWEQMRGENGDGVEVVLPPITREVLEEYAPDLLADDLSLEEAVERFEYSEGYYDWRDSFEPMMNYYWPVDLAYGVSPETAGALIEKHAGATSLVYLSETEQHAIVLTGGGMDLSWDICAAYVCCGCIPPLRLLEDLPDMRTLSREMHKRVLDTIPLMSEALDRAAERLRGRRSALAYLGE